jgi:hypothetical protein
MTSAFWVGILDSHIVAASQVLQQAVSNPPAGALERGDISEVTVVMGELQAAQQLGLDGVPALPVGAVTGVVVVVAVPVVVLIQDAHFAILVQIFFSNETLQEDSLCLLKGLGSTAGTLQQTAKHSTSQHSTAQHSLAQNSAVQYSGKFEEDVMCSFQASNAT